MCYWVKPVKRQPRRFIRADVRNQFEERALVVTRVRELCVPSEKILDGGPELDL